ncbi:MAG: DUF4292 domain-containing protein, partial [Bacteroidia bacterium]|nr:DUF4292 domain-containing protein [Bacteroidia bacterium]
MFLHTRISRFPILFLVVLSVISISLSCKTKQNLISSDIKLSKDSIVSGFLNPIDFEWFNAKAKVIFDDGSSRQKANVYIRYKRDSMIWMVVKKLGVEAARIQISPDSVTIINRLNKEYEQASVEYLEQRYGLKSDFEYIQKMIAGIPPGIDTTDKWKEVLSNKELSIFTYLYDLEYNFNFDLFSGYNTHGSFSNGKTIEGNWKYDDYRSVTENINIPFFRQFIVKLNGNESIILIMEFSSIDLDTEKPIRFNVPS